jgi:hypothetical protein
MPRVHIGVHCMRCAHPLLPVLPTLLHAQQHRVHGQQQTTIPVNCTCLLHKCCWASVSLSCCMPHKLCLSQAPTALFQFLPPAPWHHCVHMVTQELQANRLCKPHHADAFRTSCVAYGLDLSAQHSRAHGQDAAADPLTVLQGLLDR